jgi:hypothetical protein
MPVSFLLWGHVVRASNSLVIVRIKIAVLPVNDPENDVLIIGQLYHGVVRSQGTMCKHDASFLTARRLDDVCRKNSINILRWSKFANM